MGPAERNPRVFLSWCRSLPDGQPDAGLGPWVTGLRNALLEKGIDVQSDLGVTDPGSGWAWWMARGLEWADVAVAIVTPAYVDRVRRGLGSGAGYESVLMGNDAQQARGPRIVAVQHEERSCQVPSELQVHGLTRRLAAESAGTAELAGLVEALYAAVMRPDVGHPPVNGRELAPAGRGPCVRRILEKWRSVCQQGLRGAVLDREMEILERQFPDRLREVRALGDPGVDRPLALLRLMLLAGDGPAAAVEPAPDAVFVRVDLAGDEVVLRGVQARWRDGSSRWLMRANSLQPCSVRACVRRLHDLFSGLQGQGGWAEDKVTLVLVVDAADAERAVRMLGGARASAGWPSLDRRVHALAVWPICDDLLAMGSPDGPVKPPGHGATVIVDRPPADMDAWVDLRQGRQAVLVYPAGRSPSCCCALPTHHRNLLTLILSEPAHPIDALFPGGASRAARDLIRTLQPLPGNVARSGLAAWTDADLHPVHLGETL